MVVVVCIPHFQFRAGQEHQGAPNEAKLSVLQIIIRKLFDSGRIPKTFIVPIAPRQGECKFKSHSRNRMEETAEYGDAVVYAARPRKHEGSGLLLSVAVWWLPVGRKGFVVHFILFKLCAHAGRNRKDIAYCFCSSKLLFLWSCLCAPRQHMKTHQYFRVQPKQTHLLIWEAACFASSSCAPCPQRALENSWRFAIRPIPMASGARINNNLRLNYRYIIVGISIRKYFCLIRDNNKQKMLCYCHL